MKGRDLREYTRQTNIRLIIGAVLLLFLVGDGLIWWIYGPGAAVMGLLCLLAGLMPIVLIGGILWIMEWMVKRANKE
jgi:hypothetical protein